MTLQQFHYVLVIAEAGSLNRAAEQLYLSQPSLTSAVRELEKELGIVLFNRSGRGVTPTQDGAEFLLYARQLYHQYESLMDKYSGGKNIKRKFGVSTQHYSFAVKAFVELVKRFDTSQYEFAIRETKTRDVISDVATLKSEIGILYLSDFNRAVLMKLLRMQGVKTVYGIVTSPNEPSERLHESMGFARIGVMHNTGYKNGAWHDVTYFEKALAPYENDPKPVTPIGTLPEDAVLEALASL